MGVEGRWQFGVLGPLQACCGDEAAQLGGERQRLLLALLLLHANGLSTTDDLVEQFFGEKRSDGAVNAVQVAISRLRRVLERDADGEQLLQTRPGGYVLSIRSDQLDAMTFERLMNEGHHLLADNRPAAAAARLREGLALWRGRPFADLAFADSLQAEIRRLEELRLVAVMERIDADLALGGRDELIPELEKLIAADPLRERLRGQLMLALYRAGRQADALAVYHSARRDLIEAMAVEPGRELRSLQSKILEQAPELDAPAAGAGDIGHAPVRGHGDLSVGAGFANALRPLGVELFERDGDLAALADLLDGTAAGQGGVVLVEGSAGIGKTSLLQACVRGAGERGMSVLRVGGDPVVAESSFAAVRELLWNEVRDAGVLDGAARLAAPVFEGEVAGSSDRDRAGAVLHGLYWLVAGLAERAPAVLVVDDAHWLDPASARFVVYLARRIESLPVLLAVGLREREAPGGADLAATLGELAARVLRPAALTEDGSARLVRGVLSPRAGHELCRSCHHATGGNPFYLRQLAGALAAEQNPLNEVPERVRTLAAAAIADSVLVRVARLGTDCERLAQAVSVLGPGSALRQAASLAELERERAQLAADELRAAEILTSESDLSFVHPIVSEAIATELPESRRAALHREAALVLLSDDAPPDLVAAHLLSAEPYGEEWVVEALRRAGREALSQGAPEAAASYLRRALAEPPLPESRLDVLIELARAEAMLPGSDFQSFRRGLELAVNPVQRVRIAGELAAELSGVGQFGSACALLDDLLGDAGDLGPRVVQRIEAGMIGCGIGDLNWTQRALARAVPHYERARQGEIQDPVMLAVLALSGAVTGCPAAGVAELARLALQDQRLWAYWHAVSPATSALMFSDQLDDAARAQERAIAESEDRGSAPMFMWWSAMRSCTAWRAGELELAEGHAQHAIELAAEFGPQVILPIWIGDVLVERGRAQQSAELLGQLEPREPVVNLWQGVGLVAERGAVRVELGSLELGLADLLDADRRMSAVGLQLSVLTDWVRPAVLALTKLGRHDQARELGNRELTAAAQSGALRRHGIALSICGTLDRGDQGLSWLRDAVAILERSPARLEHARALVNLGTGLRARGRRELARTSLTAALEIAYHLGAASLVAHARTELVLSGARPRRHPQIGSGSVTPAELRTARMAAQGLTNRQIAQALFVSSRTVEAQLRQAYSKLGINSRANLAAALAARDRTSAQPTFR